MLWRDGLLLLVLVVLFVGVDECSVCFASEVCLRVVACCEGDDIMLLAAAKVAALKSVNLFRITPNCVVMVVAALLSLHEAESARALLFDWCWSCSLSVGMLLLLFISVNKISVIIVGM